MPLNESQVNILFFNANYRKMHDFFTTQKFKRCFQSTICDFEELDLIYPYIPDSIQQENNPYTTQCKKVRTKTLTRLSMPT